MGLLDYNLFIPRQTGKTLEALAEEVSHFTGRDWDVHDLAGAILLEFVKIHRSEHYKEIARIVTGSQRVLKNDDEMPTVRFFRTFEK